MYVSLLGTVPSSTRNGFYFGYVELSTVLRVEDGERRWVSVKRFRSFCPWHVSLARSFIVRVPTVLTAYSNAYPRSNLPLSWELQSKKSLQTCSLPWTFLVTSPFLFFCFAFFFCLCFYLAELLTTVRRKVQRNVVTPTVARCRCWVSSTSIAGRWGAVSASTVRWRCVSTSPSIPSCPQKNTRQNKIVHVSMLAEDKIVETAVVTWPSNSRLLNLVKTSDFPSNEASISSCGWILWNINLTELRLLIKFIKLSLLLYFL
jgi:hypothetical protein